MKSRTKPFLLLSIPFLQKQRQKKPHSQVLVMKKETHHFPKSNASNIWFFCTILLHLPNISAHQTLMISDDFLHHRQLLSYNGDPLATGPGLDFENPRLKNAYIALQAWKEAILSDPNNITANWAGSDVCSYTGVFCWPAPDDPCERTVAGIDVNHGDIAGTLPHELGLLYDLALFHLNSNRFCGTVPQSFTNMKFLFELDLSNNRFAGKFPELFLQLPSLKYLDMRFNEFEGELPTGLFDKDFDAIFVNDNRFSSVLPDNIGNSPVSVIVMANNKFEGCVPASLGNMSATLNELILTNNGFSSCFPSEIGKLTNLTVLDASDNQIVGPLPNSIGEMNSLEQLNVARNMMSGTITVGICQLPKLANFAYGYNYFSNESPACLELPRFDDGMNCFRGRPNQRSALQCQRFLSRSVNCSSFNCATSLNPPSFPPSSSPSPPYLSSPPPASVSPPPPFFSPPPPGNLQPLPSPQPSPTPIDTSPTPVSPPIVPSPEPPTPTSISPNPSLPPVNSSPPPSNSTPPLCPCLKPPPQPSSPPSIF